MKDVDRMHEEWTQVTLTHDSTGAPIQASYPEPLWIQAVHLIRAQIDNGTLKPGMRLAPERELCQQLGISRVTLRKALGKLVEDGVLSASHGRGWYVSKGAKAAGKEWPNSLESFSETAHRMGLTPTSALLRSEQVGASLDEAELLLIAPGTPLFHLERVRLLDDVPIALDATSILASQLGDIEGVDFTTASLYELLRDRGIEPVRADATIEAKSASAHEAELLLLEAGKPLLVMRQIAFDELDRPLFTSTIRYVGDRYRLKTFFARSGSPARATDESRIIRPRG
jgi:GntR family transcriptional regulator